MTTTLSITPTAPTLIPGIHHVSAITGDIQKNVDFYTGQMGLRLVKLTINYDDPQSHHIYYGDGLGSPGTLMTFFGWQGARQGVEGTGQVAETAFAVPAGSLGYWLTRLVDFKPVETSRFGEKALLVKDPDGLRLALVETAGLPEAAHLWTKGVPADSAIRAFHSVTLSETDASAPASILVDRFGYVRTAQEDDRIRYTAKDGSMARFVDVLVKARPSPSRIAAGEVHHVAFRTPTDADQAVWLETLLKDGHHVSPIMDRNYFHSIYFREPGGTLFEIATDGPGMTFNETAENLGTRLVLPPWLEDQRTEVEAALPKVKLPA